MVLDSDQGAEMVEKIEDMKQLVEAYRRGIIKEKRRRIRLACGKDLPGAPYSHIRIKKTLTNTMAVCILV